MARGGGSRGGSSGGRSFGGGGGRSFGGRSGGSGFNRGGVSSGGSSGRGGSSFGGPRPSSGGGGGFFGPMMMGYGMGRRRSGPRGPYYGGGGGGGCGCAAVAIVVVLVIVLAFVLFSAPVASNGGASSSNVNSITASTIEREPLPKGSVTETGYYTDELGWIGNSTTLTAGMKNFYQETGVQPYLYLTDTIDGSHSPTDAQVEAFANKLYDELFTDEAHLLLIFFEYDNNYHSWYITGSQADTVLDSEAMNILLDYIDRYYYDQDLTDEQMFSKAFDDAADRIMKVTTSPWIPVLIVVAVLAILVVAFLWWRNHKQQQNLEAEQDQKILETPLETFGSGDAAERAKKYEDD